MPLRRTANGKLIDMEALATKYETTRAVSNLKLNARGDIVDSNNNVIKKATDKVNERYQKTVTNKAVVQEAGSGLQQKTVHKTAPEVDLSQLNEFEKEFEMPDEDEVAIQKIKGKEKKK